MSEVTCHAFVTSCQKGADKVSGQKAGHVIPVSACGESVIRLLCTEYINSGLAR